MHHQITRKTLGGWALATASTTVLALAIGGGALAQEAEEAATESTGLDTIVVTAQFREQNLQDTPLSITAVSADLMEARNADSVLDVTLQAPSVKLQENTGQFGSGLSAQIRGVGQGDFNPAFEPGVGIYIDDVYFSTLLGANLDLLDLERVEILRGPQGTLSGRNSAGGAIRLISKKPTGDGSGFVSAGIGDFSALELRGGFDFGITDNLAVRVSGVHRERDGYVDRVDYGCANPDNAEGIPATIATSDCVLDKLGGVNYSGFRASALWEASDRLEITLTGDYTTQDESMNADVLIPWPSNLDVPANHNPNFVCGEFCTYSNYVVSGPEAIGLGFGPTGPVGVGPAAGTTIQPPRRMFDGFGVSGNIDFDLTDNLQLQSITAYREYEYIFGTDDDGGPGLIGQSGGNNLLNHDFLSQEVRLNGDLADGRAQFTLGAFYHDQTTTYYTQQDIRYIFPGINALQFVGNDPVNADSVAAFATVILNPIDNFTLTSGVRYTEENKDYTFRRSQLVDQSVPVPLGVGSLDGVVAEASGEEIDYRVSADYRFNEQILGYATVSTGFKGGGVTPRPFTPGHALNGSFEPETVTNYEIGAKTDLLDGVARINAAYFFMQYDNIQLPLTDCGSLDPNFPQPCAAVQNGGDAEFQGFEIEAFVLPTDMMQIDAAFSWIDSEYVRVNDTAGGATLGAPASDAPDIKASLGIQNQFAISDRLGSITPRLDVAHIGTRSFFGTVDPTYEIDPYTLVNGRLTWRNADEDTAVSLEVTNLTDEYYRPFRFDAVSGSSGNIVEAVGAPRMVMLTLRKDWN